MTFAQRQINLQFSDQTQTLNLEGLKVQAIISNPGGDNMHNFLELRAWGMSLQQMERYSSTGSQTIAIEQKSVRVSVGNVGSPVTQVFGGTIVRSALDFTQAPNVCLAVSGVAGYYYKGTPAPANSFKGSHNAEDIIAGLAKAAGLTFVNNGAHAVLQNQYLYGSLVDQMRTVAQAAAFPLSIEHDMVVIWPNDGYRDNTVIDIGPDTGMVGYPMYYRAGFLVKSEFNPELLLGRQVRVTSSIKSASKTWPILGVTHELSTQDPDGPWFSTVMLAPFPYVPTN